MKRTNEDKKMERLYDLLKEAEQKKRTEEAAALSWALYILEALEREGRR